MVTVCLMVLLCILAQDWLVVIDGLREIVFLGLSSLAIDDVPDQGDVIVVRARTAGDPVPYPRVRCLDWACARVLRANRGGRAGGRTADRSGSRCGGCAAPMRGCPVQTFREQVPRAPPLCSTAS